MKSLLNFLKSAPSLPEMTDAAEIKKEYTHWRFRILYSTFVGYVFYYFTRKSFTFAMPGIIEDLHFDKGQLGLLGSVFAISYGLSKFISGVLSDQCNPRYFMALGLIITGIINILFGISSTLFLFVLLWGLNGWFQGFGWPACARSLTHWFSRSERGSFWATWGASHSIGAFVIPWIVGLCLVYFDWRMAMFIPGILCILGGLLVMNRLRDNPQTLGLPSIEKYRNDYDGPKTEDEDKELTTKGLLKNVLSNRYIWILGLAYFFLYGVRIGIDWTALFLIEVKGYNQLSASGVVSLFEAGGFCGTLCAGVISDRLFAARRGPVNALFAILMLISILGFSIAPAGFLDSLFMFCIGFAVMGPQVLIGLTAAEICHKSAAATATGFIGLIAYVGAAAAGYPLGRIIDLWGWEGFFWTMNICCLAAIVFLLPLWNVTRATVLKEKPSAIAPSKTEAEYA